MKITCFRNRDYNSIVPTTVSRPLKKHRNNKSSKFLATHKALTFLTILLFVTYITRAAVISSTATGGMWNAGSTWVGGITPLVTDQVVIATTGVNSVTLGATATCAGLTINTGSALTVGAFAITVNGASNISGSINITSATGVKTFAGSVTVNAGGIWNNSGNSAIVLQGGLTNNGTFTAGTRTYTFSVNSQMLSGTIAIPNVTVTSVTVTNNGIFSVTSLLAGTGNLTNSATGTLNFGGNVTIATLNAIATGNLVNYNRAGSQTAKAAAYYNLTISGLGTKTFATSPSVANLLSMEGSAAVKITSGLFIYGANATLQYSNNTANKTVSAEWVSPFVASGGVIIKSPYVFTLNGSKSFNNTALTVKAGATLALGANNLTLNTGLLLEGATALAGSRITATTGTLTPGGNITVIRMGTGTNGATITARIALDADRTIAVTDDGTPATDLTITGIISGAGFGIIKAGNGTLLLSGANSFTGTTILNSGILKLGSAGNATNTPLGTTAAGTLVAAGAMLDLAGYSLATAENLTLNGSGIAGSGALANSRTNTITYTGAIALGSAGSISSTGTLNLSGIISGSYNLTKAGTGTVSLSGINTFTGGVTLNSGTLNINNSQALGTVDGTFTINGGAINNTSAATVITLSYPIALNANFTFIGSRSLNLGTGLVTFNADRQVTTNANSLTFGGSISAASFSLTKTGNGTLNLGTNAVALKNLIISAGTVVSTSGLLSLTGNFSNSGIFTHNSGTVAFNGSTAQVIAGTTATAFSKLTLNNLSGLALSNSVNTTITGVLTLLAGNITTNANTLILSSTASVSRTLGHVAGNLMKNVARAANVSRTFEVGDASNYTPVTLLFANVTTAGNLTVKTTSADHPSLSGSAINVSRSVNRYWTSTNNGIICSAAGYSVTFTFVDGDVDGGANTGSFIINRYAAGTWTSPTVGTRTSTSTQATVALATAFGDFAIGATKPTATVTTLLSSSNPSCNGLPVTLTATVTSGGLPVVSEGTVTFKDGATTIGTSGILDGSGKGTFTTSALASGIHSITAVYNATGNFASSSSAVLSQDVTISYQWIGGVSGDWENAANWCGGVPNAAANVVIPGGTTVNVTSSFVSPAICNNLTISAGAAIIIKSGKALTVNGLITNNATAGIVIRSDMSGTGSLLDNGNAGAGTALVERYITKYNAVGDGMFHFLSAPVTGQSIVSSFGNPASNFTDDFYKMDEATYTWVSLRAIGNVVNPSFETTFTRGRGYLVAYNANATRSFTGQLNSGTYTAGTGLVAISYTTSLGASAGWNLVGNPYPSAIRWDNISGAQSVNLDKAVYVYDNATQQYKTYVNGLGTLTDGIIPAMQGFLVKANGTSPSLTLENQDRVHGGNVYYKSRQTATENVLSLKVSGNAFQDETFIRFNDAATADFNNGWDAYKLMGGLVAPSIYSVTNNLNYVVNTLPLNRLQGSIPVAVAVASPGTYTITADGIDSFVPGISVSLRDKQKGITTILGNNTQYAFTASPADAPDRFELTFLNVTSLPEPDAGETFTAIQSNGNLIINTQMATGAEIVVYNMAGQSVLHKSISGDTQAALNISGLKSGVYVVSLLKGTQKTSKKIVIK